MGKLLFELHDELIPTLRMGEIESCERVLLNRLAAIRESPFHIALDLTITNNPSDIAAYFDGFFRKESLRFDIRAAYAEMNGFDINTDRWYFDVFAFTEYGGRDDYDWLADWESERYPEMTITGLEPLQKVYEESYDDENFGDASDVVTLLVVTKFQDLIRRATADMSELRFPLLATTHDFDAFIYEARRVD
ncbi:MAG: hypothetical protein PSX80_07070 [bacterium]|nr:hypothetical protein [bacterium]